MSTLRGPIVARFVQPSSVAAINAQPSPFAGLPIPPAKSLYTLRAPLFTLSPSFPAFAAINSQAFVQWFHPIIVPSGPLPPINYDWPVPKAALRMGDYAWVVTPYTANIPPAPPPPPPPVPPAIAQFGGYRAPRIIPKPAAHAPLGRWDPREHPRRQ